MTELKFYTVALAAMTLSINASAQFSSTAKMLGMTQTWNTSLWTSQAHLNRTIQQGEIVALGSSSQAPATAPRINAFQISINATDFQGMPWREVPERLLGSMPQLTEEQKIQMRIYYNSLLDSFEMGNRKQNVASAVAYAIGTGMEITRVKALSPSEAANVLGFVNGALANAPQFRDMTPQQKQIIYESSVISGGIARALFVEGTTKRDPAIRRQADELARTILRQWTGS